MKKKCHHTLHRQQLLPISLEKAWTFVSSPQNLTKITPPEMGFEIITEELPDYIYNGMIIEYKVRPLYHIPVKWVSKITDVVPKYRFTDIQIKGPYSLWEHRHILTERPDGVMMTDWIQYSLPLGRVGDLLHTLLIKKQLENIFQYRKERIVEFFGVAE